MNEAFRVGLTKDFLRTDGTIGFGDIGLELLDSCDDVQWEFLSETAAELSPKMIRDYDALLMLGSRLSAASLLDVDRLKIVARFGVGYDSVDVDACTDKGVLLTNTPDGVRRPVAVAAMTLLLALSYRLLTKDKITREGRWSDRLNHLGQGLTGRTLGVVGLGNTGREVLRLAAPFGLRHIGCDPYVDHSLLADLNVEVVDLEPLLGNADYVVLCTTLTAETRHLINADRIQLMKPSAYLINMARGPVVDQVALTEALRGRRIQGAGLDVFEQEPIDPRDPILSLDNVIVTPHSLCWTDEMALGTGRDACQSILDVARGRAPKHIVNREVLQLPQLRAQLG